MGRAGYVLAGGRSSRMGTDKALLPYYGITLIEHVAGLVQLAAGSVCAVGGGEACERLGLRVIPDLWPGCGPLAGIHAALSDSSGDWNLVLACDMPAVPPVLLEELFVCAENSEADCVVPLPAGERPQPLCAVYHRRCASSAGAALAQGRRKLAGWLGGLRVEWRTAVESHWFVNTNTPEEWRLYLREEIARSPHGV